MTRFKGCYSLRVSTCLFIFTLCGRITGALNERVKVTVMEEDDVILPCSLSTKEDIEFKLFDWRKDGQKEVFMYDGGVYYDNGLSGQDEQFKGRVSHFSHQLKNGNASIKIQNTKVDDSGNYTCDFPRLQPRKTFHIELVVVGAASEPYATTIKRDNEVLLQCRVLGVFQKPEVEWKDSSGNIVPAKEPMITERGGSYDVILQAPVTKTDNFHCVVTQKEIDHQIYAEIYATHGDSTGWIVAAVLGFLLPLLVLVVGVVLFAKGIIEVNHIKSRRRHENGSGNPPVSHHELERFCKEPLITTGSDVSTQTDEDSN